MRHNLIVSKNTEMITFLRERYLGETWEVTDSPDRAIEALEREPFDRIFLDHWLNAPQDAYNGRDVTRYLGTHPECNPRVEIIATTTDVDKARKMIGESRRETYHIPWSQIQKLGK